MASRRCGSSRGSSSGLRHELIDLSNHLRQERLYVQSEKAQVSCLRKPKLTSQCGNEEIFLPLNETSNQI